MKEPTLKITPSVPELLTSIDKKLDTLIRIQSFQSRFLVAYLTQDQKTLESLSQVPEAQW